MKTYCRECDEEFDGPGKLCDRHQAEWYRFEHWKNERCPECGFEIIWEEGHWRCHECGWSTEWEEET